MPYRRTPELNRKQRLINEARHPEAIQARIAVRHAIRAGRLIRGTCEVCGVSKVDAHHDDYSKRLEVRWLCRQHHADLHHPNTGAAADSETRCKRGHAFVGDNAVTAKDGKTRCRACRNWRARMRYCGTGVVESRQSPTITQPGE